MSKATKTVRLLAVLSMAAASMAVHADEIVMTTQTVGGITWRLYFNKTAQTVCVGTNTTGTAWSSASNYNTSRAIADSTSGRLEVPATFTIDDVVCKTTRVGNRAFIRCKKVTDMVIPEHVSNFLNCSVYECTGLKSVWFKGPATVAEDQQYVTLTFNGDAVFSLSSAIKYVLVGPNIKKGDSNLRFPAATGALVLLPRLVGNTTWNNANVAGTNPAVFYYTAIDETEKMLTLAPPTTASAILTLLAGKAEVKSRFGYDVQIDTGALQDSTVDLTCASSDELSSLLSAASSINSTFGCKVRVVNAKAFEDAVTLPDSALEYVTFDSRASVTFAVNTQADLDKVLSVLSRTSPAIIDVTGASENITIPNGWNTEVRIPPTATVSWKIAGVMIIVR